MSMTTYGTIQISSSSSPESSSPPSSSSSSNSNPNPNSRAQHKSIKRRRKHILGNCRPWNIMFKFSFFALPTSLSDAVSRIRFNIAFFRLNYTVLAMLFLLPWYPLAFAVVSFSVWLLDFFLRRCPTPVIFGRPIAYRAILVVILVVMVVMQSSAAELRIVSAAVMVGAAALMVAHAALRKTEDLDLEEEEDGCKLMPDAAASTTGVAASTCATGSMPRENINV